MFCFTLLLLLPIAIRSQIEPASSLSTTSINSTAETNAELNTNSDEDDLRAFELFKYFVYPSRYEHEHNQQLHINRTTMSPNITIDWIRSGLSQQHLEHQPRIDDDFETRVSPQRRQYQQNDPHYFYPPSSSVGFANPTTTTGHSMSHIMDPLFLMATLAFVAFLINSILGLVNRLNLPAVVRGRRHNFVSFPASGEQRTVNEDLLDEIELVLNIAFEQFEKRFSLNNQ